MFEKRLLLLSWMIALVEYSRLQFFLFSPLNLSCHSLLACRLCWKIHWQPYGVSLPSNGFLFAAFAILSLSLLSSILITMYPRVDLPGLICFQGSLCLLDLDLFPSSDSRKFSACFFKYSASLSCPPGIPIIECFAWWCYWVHDFHFFFLSWSAWLLSIALLGHRFILPLVCCLFRLL